jgi:hypothetical protein
MLLCSPHICPSQVLESSHAHVYEEASLKEEKEEPKEDVLEK